MIDRFISSVVALSLASLMWLYVRSRDLDSLDNVPVPVHISLASGLSDQYELDLPDPCQVLTSFTGPPSRIREVRNMLHHGDLRVEITLTVPESLQNESPYLATVRVETSDIRAPQGVTPLVVEGRNRIPVTLHRLVERRFPVRFTHLLEERFGQATLEPATVLVRGAREILDRVREVPTQPFVLPPANEKAPEELVSEAILPLARELDGRAIRARPESVFARVTLRPRQKVYELTDVPVQFLCPAGFNLRPQFTDERAAKIAVRLQGPATEEPLAVVAYVDLTGRKLEPGMYADEPLRLQLPKDFQLAQKPPRSASFRLLPLDVPLKERDPIRGP